MHFKTLLETDGSRVKVRRSRQVFPHFGRVLIRPGTSARGFEMRSKAWPTEGIHAPACGPVVVVVPVVARRGVVHTRALYKALRHPLRYYDHYHHYGVGTAR